MVLAIDSQRLIQAIVNAQLLESTEDHGRSHRSCVVTVSRSYGAGGERIARELAEALHLTYCDRKLVEAVAESAHVESYLFDQLDEKVRGLRTTWLESIITNKNELKDKYRKNLINVVLGMTRTGGVILGRGANFILGPQAFRVRIVGSPQQCAARVAACEHIDHAAALSKVINTNEQRREFVRMMYDRDISDACAYDLVINTEHLAPEGAVALITEAMVLAGFLASKEGRPLSGVRA